MSMNREQKRMLQRQGEVDADGAIQGTFEVPAGGFSPFQDFVGTLAGAGN